MTDYTVLLLEATRTAPVQACVRKWHHGGIYAQTVIAEGYCILPVHLTRSLPRPPCSATLRTLHCRVRP